MVEIGVVRVARVVRNALLQQLRKSDVYFAPVPALVLRRVKRMRRV